MLKKKAGKIIEKSSDQWWEMQRETKSMHPKKEMDKGFEIPKVE